MGGAQDMELGGVDMLPGPRAFVRVDHQEGGRMWARCTQLGLCQGATHDWAGDVAS